MQVWEFNALPDDDAGALVTGCLRAPRWVDAVVTGRPYSDADQLAKRAHEAALHLTDRELADALTGHPRIGDLPTGDDAESRSSRREQAGVDAAHATRLRAANERYEAHFGHVFMIRATGRDSGEILTELERRLANDEATEREETVTALREIALLRLRELVR